MKKFSIALVVLALAVPALATPINTYTFVPPGTTPVNWTDANWTGGPNVYPGVSGDAASVTGAITATTTLQNIGAIALDTLKIGSATGTSVYTLNGGTITFDDGGTISKTTGGQDVIKSNLVINGTVTANITTSRIKIQGSGISGSGTIIKTGSGMLYLDTASSFNGTLIVKAGNVQPSGATGGHNTLQASTIQLDGGTFQMADSNNLGTSSNFIMNGGFLNCGGAQPQTVGTMQLLANSSMDLASAAVWNLADSSAVAWTAGKILTIAGYDPLNSHIFFGNSATGLTADQLAEITFSGNANPAMILPTGEVVPAPEPATLGLLVLGGLGVLARRRRA